MVHDIRMEKGWTDTDIISFILFRNNNNNKIIGNKTISNSHTLKYIKETFFFLTSIEENAGKFFNNNIYIFKKWIFLKTKIEFCFKLISVIISQINY